jgi:hypothetical protein
VAVAKAGENRQCEGSRFSGTGLGGRDEVLLFEHGRKRAQLDWAGIDIAHALRTVNDGV